MLGKFVQRNFPMESLSDKCTVPQPSLRISLELINNQQGLLCFS